MNQYYILLSFLGLMMIVSCTNRQVSSTQKQHQKELAVVVEMMAGKFSSATQAKEDSLFYDISLTMYPIWETEKRVKWLYVEQAVTQMIKKPYRQRVYRLTKTADGTVESRVFELPNPAKYIHGWEEPTIFNQITPDSLIVRQGCAVFLKKGADNCYVGSTKDKDCKSTLRGASYATSEVQICANQIVSWDQGWNDNDKQVWGAETKGYIFQRLDK